MHNQTQVTGRWRRAKRALAACAIVAAVALGCGREQAPQQKRDTPRPPNAAASSAEVVDTARLVEVLKTAQQNGAVIVNFWATWCPPCVREMPVFADFCRKHARRRATLISVSVDHPDTVDERVRPFLKSHKIPFPVYVLSERSPEAVAKALRVDWTGAVPATFVFDTGGHLVKTWLEEITSSDLAAAIGSAR